MEKYKDRNGIEYTVYSIPLKELYAKVLDRVDTESYFSSTKKCAGVNKASEDVFDIGERWERVEQGLDVSFFIVHHKGTQLYLLDGFTRLTQMIQKYPNLVVWVREYCDLSYAEWFSVMLSANIWKFSTYTIDEWVDRGFALALEQEFGLDVSTPILYTAPGFDFGFNRKLTILDLIFMYTFSAVNGRSYGLELRTKPVFCPPVLGLKEKESDTRIVIEALFLNPRFVSDIQQCCAVLSKKYEIKTSKGHAVIEPLKKIEQINGKKEMQREPFYMLLEYIIHAICILRIIESRQGVEMHDIDVEGLQQYVEHDIVEWVCTLTTLQVTGVQQNRIADKASDIWVKVKELCNSTAKDIGMYVYR